MFKKQVTNIFSLYGKYFILALTLLSLCPILIIRISTVEVDKFTRMFFWVHSFLTLLYLLFIYHYAYKYKPLPDVGYRPTVTVVVPCKNEENGIKNTIEAIMESDYPKEKLKAIVVDDGSTDNTYIVAKQCENERVKIIKHEKNKGKRQACATGVREADSEIVVLIDSDTVVAKDGICLLVQPFLDEKVVAACGRAEAANIDKNMLTKMQHYWYQRMFVIVKGMESKLNCVTCCSGLLAAYRRQGVNEVSNEWLNEIFFGRHVLFSDDRQLTNLSARGVIGLSTRDAKVVYQSNAVAYTMVPDNFKQFFKQQLRWKRGWLHGFKLASQFMWRKRFPVPLYYYISILLALSMPIVIIKWLVFAPLSGNLFSTILYVLTLSYVALLHGINTWFLTPSKKSKTVDMLLDYIFYMIIFVPLTIILSVQNIYAWATLWKVGWITRADKVKNRV